MKTLLQKTLVLAILVGGFFTYASAQYQKISVRQLQFVSATNLAACNDSSAYLGDTVTIVGRVTCDANLIDVPSSSVQGGFRPFVHVMDTADNSSGGDFKGLQVMGVYTDASGASLPVTDIYNLYAGMVVEFTGIVGRYQGETQLSVLNNSSMNVLGNSTAPAPVVVDLGKLNGSGRVNNLETGEEYEDSYVEIRNLTVINVQPFNNNRVSFDVTDENGNTINISDRFFVQKTGSYSTSRSSAPVKQGTFVAPAVGTKYDYLRGIVIHSDNGCTGNNGRGYELNPFDTSHYRVGKTPPSITKVVRTPLVPKDVDKVIMEAKIIDFDGTVASTSLFYTTNINAAYNAFIEVVMVLKSGTTDTYEAEIPANTEGTIVRYYLYATDDIGQKSYMPFSASAGTNPDFSFYTVRNNGLSISDVQRVLNVQNDASPYNNQVVTVTGVVTASAKAYDLEAIYIQDATATEWAAIKCQGNSDLIKLYRGDEVTVTGTVAESFGFTILNVTSVTKTGNIVSIKPVAIDPSDSTFYFSKNAEKYEGMLVGMANPAGGKVYISNPRYNNFGEYLISTNEDASYGMSRRVQAGIQNATNASSLWVSLVSDSTLKDQSGTMNVAPIETAKGMSFDTVVGIMYYGFGNYNVLPRNNDDFIGSSVTLSGTMYPDRVSVENLTTNNRVLRFYPNPTTNRLNVQRVSANLGTISIKVYSLTGSLVASYEVDQQGSIDVSMLTPGAYILHCVDGDNNQVGSFRLIKQ